MKELIGVVRCGVPVGNKPVVKGAAENQPHCACPPGVRPEGNDHQSDDDISQAEESGAADGGGVRVWSASRGDRTENRLTSPVALCEAEAVTSRISHITIDARDAYAQSVWCGDLLGMAGDPEDANEPGDEECMIFSTDGEIPVLFIAVPDGKQVKNRLHFDLRPVDGSREQEVERLVGLGAAVVADRRRPDGSGWFTLADPEGNEFCVLPASTW